MNPAWWTHPRVAALAAAAFFLLEAVQGIVLLPWLRLQLGPAVAASWVLITASAPLVGLMLAGRLQPTIRALARQGGPGGLPANWDLLIQSWTRWSGAGLLLMQLAFVLVMHLGGFGPAAVSAPEGWLAAGLYGLGQHLRLQAFAGMAALTGQQQTGRERSYLALTSALGLAALLLMTLAGLGMPGLGLAVLLAQAALLFGVRRAVAAMPRGSVPMASFRWQDGAGLTALAVAGFCASGTDILMAGHWLPAAELVGYAFASRALTAVVALCGLWAQLRFPRWCSEARLSAGLAELKGLMSAIAAGLVLAACVLGSGWLEAPLHKAGAGFLNDGVVQLLLLLGAWLACLTATWGQVLLAVDVKQRFVWPCAVLALAAPPMAWLLGSHWGLAGMLLGYAATHLAVALVLARRTMQLLNSTAPRAPARDAQ
ncbi:hypothetical protein [Roseateles flavus]|uniref:Polysaccharide biosynthesis protein n=1 Tax=Roseateles flavus TaxID=3149041 RepID=A0ABV0GAF9_9BURK